MGPSELYHYHAISKAEASCDIHAWKCPLSSLVLEEKSGGSIKAASLLEQRKPNVFCIHEFQCLLRGLLEDL